MIIRDYPMGSAPQFTLHLPKVSKFLHATPFRLYFLIDPNPRAGSEDRVFYIRLNLPTDHVTPEMTYLTPIQDKHGFVSFLFWDR